MSDIHTGVWTDWSRGRVFGATLTLTKRDGALLLAFITAFVTFTAGRLWRICCYAAHQLSVQTNEQDALYFQRQSIFRNSASASDAAGLFLQQWWNWRRYPKSVFFRTIPWSIVSILFAILFAAVAILSSAISSSMPSVRVVTGQNCGFLLPPMNEEGSSQAWLVKQASDIRAAATYARACYGQTISSGQTDCSAFAKPSMSYYTNKNAKCPFNDSGICLDGAVLEMISQPMDSHHDLGINSPPDTRLQLQMKTVCSAIHAAGYWTYVDANTSAALGWPEKTLVTYNYGNYKFLDGTVQNHTFLYNVEEANMGSIYSVPVVIANANDTNGWIPIDALYSRDADTSLALIRFGSVLFLDETNDPIFNATIPKNLADKANTTVWEPARFASPLACQHRYQVCAITSNTCSPWLGRNQLLSGQPLGTSLKVNDAQSATYLRLVQAISYTTFYDMISTRLTSALRASDKVLNLQQLPIPDDQWHIEVRSWFEESLTTLQRAVQEYASPPDIKGATLLQPWLNNNLSQTIRSTLQDMCDNQRVQSTSNTMSFSILGLIVTFVLGGVIILVSLFMTQMVGALRSFLHLSPFPMTAWTSDAFLNAQQILLQNKAGMGSWTDKTASVPALTEVKTAPSHALFVEEERSYNIVQVSVPK